MKFNKIRFIFLFFLIMFLALNLSSCGSTGGMNEDGGDDGTDAVVETIGSITLSTESEAVFADGASSTQIRALVENTEGFPITQKAIVKFSSPMGTLSATSVETVNGIASVTLTSPPSVGSSSIRASVSGLSADPITINFIPVPHNFTLSSTKSYIKTDGVDNATITATLLDSNFVAVQGITVIFSAGGGQLSRSAVVTNDAGNASVVFSVGMADKSNQTININAAVQGFASKSIPVQIIGTEIEISSEKTQLDLSNEDKTILTVTARDAGLSPIFNAEITAKVIPGDPDDPMAQAGNLTIKSADFPDNVAKEGVLTGTTNLNGEFKIEVTGTQIGNAAVEITALGYPARSQTYNITSSGGAFLIISSEEGIDSMNTSEEFEVVVKSPSNSPVQFTTTFGKWENGEQIIEKPVGEDGLASAKLTSIDAGIANIQVFDTGDPKHATSDSLRVAISAPSDTAASISLQAVPSVVAPSLGDTVNTSVITATVKNAKGQVVGDAPIAFSIENTTGGGESLSPVIAYTNSSGVATTTFYSGTLSSSGLGVNVNAVVLVNNHDVKDSISIKIGGTAGSVLIGSSNVISTSSDETAYILPMSVLVSDSNGNPVSGAKVTLGVWPVKYRTGYLYEVEGECVLSVTGVFDNEDINKNLTLDAGEDSNGDGLITPQNSAAGNIARSDNDESNDDPSYIITTGKDGIAAFNLTYLTSSAVWIYDEITATTRVSGTETKASFKLWLPLEEGDCDSASPYNGISGSDVEMTAEPNVMLADGKSKSTIKFSLKNADGTPAEDGVRINFFIEQGPGKLLSDFATTVGGIASVEYQTSDGIGTVVIRGEKVDKTSSATVQIVVNPDIGAISLKAADERIPDDGVSSTTITASVSDNTGGAVPVGTPITFVTTAGKFSNGEQTYTIKTVDTSGSISIPLIAGDKEAIAEITCSSGGVTQKTTVFIGEGAGVLPPNKIVLIPDSDEGEILLISNGNSAKLIQAQVTNIENEPVTDGEKISFTITQGTGSFDPDRPITQITVPTAGGTASVTYYSSKEPGDVEITARAVNGNNVFKTTTITLSEGTLTLSAIPKELVADGSSESTITVNTTFDAEPGPDGDRLTFTIDGEGTFSTGDKIASATTTGGVASVTYVASRTVGDVKITVKGSGYETYTSTVEDPIIKLSAQKIGTLTVSAADNSIPADNISSTNITASVKSNTGQPIVKGTIVTFTTNLGTFSSVGEGEEAVQKIDVPIPDDSGSVTVPLIAGNTPGIAKIIVNVKIGDSNVTQQTTVTFTPGPQIIGIQLSSNKESIPADGKSKAVITATVSGSTGEEPPDGVTVKYYIKSGKGSWVGGTGTDEGATVEATTASGITRATLISAEAPGTIVTIRADAGDFSDEIEIEYAAGEISLDIIPNTILGTGIETAKIRATLKDTEGNILDAEDGTATLKFSLSDQSMGNFIRNEEIVPTDTIQTTTGQAEAIFQGAAKGGTVTILAEAKWGNITVNGDIEVNIHPPPAFIVVAEPPDPPSISIRGTGGEATTSKIAFNVMDVNGEPVVDGYRIYFEILTGPDGGEEIAPYSAETSGGKVVTILRSGYKSGPVNVKATYFYDTNVSTSTSQIAIQNGPPVGEEFGISRKYLNISGLALIGINDLVTVDVGDIYGNSVPENTAISFKTYNTGGLLTPGSSSTKAGIATSTLMSAAAPVPMQGMVSVTAEAVNGGRTTHVKTIAVVPVTEHSQILYAGTDGGGVYVSRDSGTSWKNTSRSPTIQGQNWIDPYVNDIAVDPDNYNVVYAATGYLGQGNVYRSLDGGLNWNSNNPEEWYGIFRSNMAVLSILCDDDGDRDTKYLWIGTEGEGAWYYEYHDGYKRYYFKQSNGLGHGTIVHEIVKVKETHGETAHLYSGTATGVFKSTDGGRNWNQNNIGRFTGDFITTMALYPKLVPGGNDVIYVGTEGAGIWVSTDSGQNWSPYNSGMSKGLTSTIPKANVRNIGTGVISKVEVLSACKSETWTVTCIEEEDNGGTFRIEGSVSGIQDNYNIKDEKYKDGYYIPNVLKFTISPGTEDFQKDSDEKAGDSFTFRTTRDPGNTIKDILVDKLNHRLYAITYFNGPLEPHSVGNVYVHDLKIDGSMTPGDWKEANKGLPQFDPPDDTTLFAQHVMAFDNLDNPKAIFIGGEGINFYKATSGLSIGDPDWQDSKSGITNLVMARLPVIFSGISTMKIWLTKYVPEPKVDSAGRSYTDYDLQFYVYIEDINGNPPIQGSYFEVWERRWGVDSQLVETVYVDQLFNVVGTHRDPDDPLTDIPYIINADLTRRDENDYWGSDYDDYEQIEFTFDPTNPTTTFCDDDDGPGCSGGKQFYSYDASVEPQLPYPTPNDSSTWIRLK